MSNTASAMLNEANKHIGVSGRPNVFTREYASRHGNAFLDAPWCDMFQTYCARHSGASAVLPHGDEAWTVAHASDFAKDGHWHAGTSTEIKLHAEPGDVVFFDWGGTDSRNAIDHVGVVLKNLGDGRVTTIEGNTSDSVRIRVRAASVIAGFGKPKYDAAPAPKPITDSAWPYKSTTEMKLGWTNSAGVLKVQNQLNAKGYTPKLVADSDFGSKTETAVKWFQGKNGLTKDGIVGPLTWAKLFS